MSFTGPPSFTSSDESTNIRPGSMSSSSSWVNTRNNKPVSMTYRLRSGIPGISEADRHYKRTCLSLNLQIPGYLDHLKIPLEDIIQATNNFAQENIIEEDYDWKVYKGELSEKKLAFVLIDAGYKQLNFGLVVTLSSLPEPQNVVSLIGICVRYSEIILVLEHPTRGGLDKHVSGAHLTWLMRVKICLDIASGMRYLQTHSQTREMKIEDLNSKYIHLDENWQAKIQLFTPSTLTDDTNDHKALSVGQVVANDSELIDNTDDKPASIGTLGRDSELIDNTGMQSEIYSFGVILFELLCGRLAVDRFFSKLVRSHYEKGTLTEIIDPVLRAQMNRDSFTVFSEIAYACLEENQGKRPTISQVVEELQKVLRLQQGFETSELQQLSYCNFLNVISYVCLDEKQVKRPTNSTVVEELQKVLKLQQGFEIPEHRQVNSIQHMKIPLEDIRSATRDFHDDYTIPRGTCKVYKAELYHFNVDKYVAENKIKRVSMKEILEYPRRKSTVAIKSIDGGYGQQTEERLQMLLYLSHENLVKLVGFCDDDDKSIHVVYEYASNRSLDDYIHRQHINYQKYYNTNPTSMRNIFPWVLRMQFCLDAARGLNFLHNGSGKNDMIIHGNIKSSNIFISRDGVGMIGDFGLSTNQCSDTHRLTKEYDVYSFGLVLFEVLSGVLTPIKISEDDPKFLPGIVKRGFNQGDLNDIIDPMLKKEFDTYHASLIGDRSAESLNIFVNIACQCFHEEYPPAMADIVKELEKAYRIHVESLEKRQKDEDNAKVENLKHLKIPFKEIYSATNGFVDSCMIGWGGFGGVYKAELFHVDVRKYVGKKESLVELYGYPRRKGKVALKRREITSGQGRNEFWKEIDVLSGLNHQNIVSLVGFCYEYGEMIIIYDYAYNGSFEKYIRNVQNLNWEQRLQICIDAAQGLDYLHNHHIIHRDVKSPNILLGDSLEGMIGDVGLSLTVKNTDSQLSNIIPVGTGGYLDPSGTGKVYKADLHHFNADKDVAQNKIKRVSMNEIFKYPIIKSTVAIKSIDGGYRQRTEELLQKLLYLSHENVVDVVGFCDEDHERILVVYEYASNGSLDEYIRRQHIKYQKYITNPTGETLRNIFPWVIRLQFCLDAARGLNFLHSGNGENDPIIHGNIKSSNILLGRDGVGMIGDFGFSTNQNTHRLMTEYDVFSFGLVLFEVLHGKLTHFKISEDDRKFLPEIVKLGFNPRKLDNIIDPMLHVEFKKGDASSSTPEDEDSIDIFANIAYRCFEEVENRPKMAEIVEKLEEAYSCHVKSFKQRQGAEDNSKMKILEHLKIPFKEIYSATKGFDDSCMIGWGGFGGVYSAELFHVDVRKYVGKKESLVELYGYPRRKGKVALKRREIKSGQGREQFLKEIDVLSGLNHQNIISLVGFCYEYGEMIIIYDYASNGSFEKYIPNDLNLKWEQRLQICIDAAQGLNYLHNNHIIHRDVKSGNILLGDNLEGIIGDVGLSITINSADSKLIVDAAGTRGYIDPKYYTSGILTKQSDMYSFGVVLLEVLCGKFVSSDPAKYKVRALLVEEAEQHLTSNQPSQIIGGYLKKDLKNGKFLDSIKTFAAITHDCLHSTDGDETHRLTMADILKGLKKALAVHSIGSEPFSLEEIKSATNNFSEKLVIGRGASGKIYKGELPFSKKSIAVAVKRLVRARSYEEGAFLKEVVKLSRYVHENIISLRGFCEEDNEKIIIIDHASNESLDKHLDKSILTWGVRLKISIGAAKGLNHIHSFEKDQKTVHGDIKSSNILLDHDWKACISDFIVSKSHGTLGYRDPEYSSSGATKEADVYSFGVVLFELLSGRRAIDKVEKYSHPTLRQIIDAGDGVKDEKDAGDGVKDKKDAGDGVKDKKAVSLTWMAERCLKEKKLAALIFDDIKKQTDEKSIGILLKVAYECLHKDQEKRPTMTLVIQELEKALNIHVDWEFEQKLPKDNENIMKMIKHRESKEITKKDLYPIFSSGILLNNGKVLLSLNKDGKAKEMISATMFSYEKCWSSKWKVLENSRFGTVAKISDTSNLKIQINIKSQFLSLGIIYGAYLVFKFSDTTTVSSEPYVKLEYSIASEDLNSYVAVRRDDGWMMIELCRFRNHNQITEFKVQLERFWGHPCGSGPIFVDGIEFRPIENVEHEESVDRSINADSSINWDQQSSSDFQEILKRSENDVPTTTKEELHKLLSTGVLIDNGEKLFSLSKVDGKKCHMLPAKAVINKSPDAKFTKCPSSTMSRFEEVVELQRHQAFSINCNIETKLLSPDTAYACYLVFQLPENSEGLKCPVKARDLLNKNNKESTIIYLRAPEPVDLYRDKRVPDRREDGWMEVRVWEFVYDNEIKDIPMELKLSCLGGTMSGLTVCGIEFRPL